ncbi:hypothetical protein N7530_009706 [Penicillium desertorum]|uniref:Uncharacterized protein n=1 Tax=Penicillium desertorum TaxID=1303715 RepID=A0A9W9WJ07_9EURO|nr:hypothetical protein N7530_009706 [Penicillium desertorum]
MKVEYAILTVIFLDLVIASPTVKDDGHENLEGTHQESFFIYKNGECDWIDPDCKSWDFFSCECKDTNYVSQSSYGDNLPNTDNNSLSYRRLKIGGNWIKCNKPDNPNCPNWNETTCKCEGEKTCEHFDPTCIKWD